MKNNISSLMQKPFIRNVFILATGTAMAQGINFVFSPLLTRLYGPEAYGLMGIFNAIVSIIAPIAALTYPIAIVLPKEEEEAYNLTKISLFISLLISILATLILLLFHSNIVEIFQLEEISGYLYLIPLIVLSAGFLQVMEQWLIRTKQFNVSARVKFLEALVINGGKAGIGFFNPTAWVLILFTAIRQGIKGSLLLFFSDKDKIFLNNITRNNVKKTYRGTLKKFKDFPLFRAPEVFLNAISGSLPVLMLTSFFGPAAAGFYSIGRTVLSIPSQLIGKAVADVFYPRISEAKNDDENLTTLIIKATFALAGVGIVPYGFIFLFGPWIFGVVFGNDWVLAGEYARWMALWTYFGFINRPSVASLPVLSAQLFHLIYTIIMLVTRLVVLFIGFYVFSSDIIVIALFSIAGAVLNIGLILMTLYISRKRNSSK